MLPQPPKTIKATDVSEKAFQRALFNVNETRKGDKTIIKWLDYELPVVINGNPRKDSLDLIGIYMNGRQKGTFIICEVKFSYDNKHSDCPSKAVEELQRYSKSIGDGSELELKHYHHGIPEFDWRKVPLKYEKWILANSAYWAYWLGHQKTNQETHEKEERWSFQEGIYYGYVDIPGNTFQKQDKDSLTYIPEFPEKTAFIRTIWPNRDSK